MYKLQAFCVLVFTFLAFSQETPVLSKKTAIRTAQKDVESLAKMNEVKMAVIQFRVPSDVQDNCTVNALDCFCKILEGIKKKLKNISTVANTIDHVISNVEEIMGMDPKERKEKELCYIGCTYSMERRNTSQALEDFLKLLQQMYQAQKLFLF